MSKENQKDNSDTRPVGTVAELFAGVGGFRLGLRDFWDVTYSNQFEPSTPNRQLASECYVRAFGPNGHSNEDIAQVVERHLLTGAEIPRTTMLVGGFPCQDYSVAKPVGHSRGIQGKKGVLWWEIFKIVKKNEPKYVLLENVDRLLSSPASKRGRDFGIMLRTLGGLGYLIEWRVINAADFGFPQKRRRVFILAKKLNETKQLPHAHEAETFLESKGLLAKTFPGRLRSGVKSFSIAFDPDYLSNEFNWDKASKFENAGYYLKGKVFTGRVDYPEPESPATLGSVVIQNPSEIAEEFWIDPHKLDAWAETKVGGTKNRTHKLTGITYNYSEGSMSFPDRLDRPSRTIVTGEGGTSPSRFKHVIEQDGRHRRLTPVELEMLNGFPPNHTMLDLSGKEISSTKRAFFMGNALVVGLVRMIGETLASDHVSSDAEA
jgi:DNA (cytosine-5)-methyltransferase 1